MIGLSLYEYRSAAAHTGVSVVTTETWTDAAKAWAPIVIAGGVFMLQALQIRWQRMFNGNQADLAERQLRNDVRKFRLAMLDKRLLVLEQITKTLAASAYVKFDAGANAQLFDCLLAGQTLFDEPLAQRLDEAWELQIKYQNAWNSMIAHSGAAIGLAPKDRAENKAEGLRAELFEKLKQLRAEMIVASRVDGVSLAPF